MLCRDPFECSVPRLPQASSELPNCHSFLPPHLARSANKPCSVLPNPNSSLSHLYQSKQFINSLISYTSTLPSAQTLSFDRHPYFTGGWVGYLTGYPCVAISAICPPVSPLDKALTDTPSGNPLYLPLLREIGGVGAGGWRNAKQASPVPRDAGQGTTCGRRWHKSQRYQLRTTDY